MKKYIYILAIVLFSCDSENAWDCIQESGSIVQQDFEVTSFEKILVNRDVELIVQEGVDFKVVIETGENLLNDISVKVVDGELQLTDNNTCNYVRDYGITKAYVTAPDVKVIRTSSQMEVSSIGVLNYDNLQLLCEDYNAPGTFTVGDFRLQVNSTQLSVVSNNISAFYISGQVDKLNINFASGGGRFQGENLIAQNVNVYHRGSNDMIVNPQLSLKGKLLGTGNLISFNQPAIVEVEQLYTGKLIFQD